MGDGLARAAVGLQREDIGTGAGLDVERRHVGGDGAGNWLAGNVGAKRLRSRLKLMMMPGLVGFLKVGCCTEAGGWSQLWWGRGSAVSSSVNLE